MNKVLYIVLLFSLAASQAQNGYVYKFDKMPVIIKTFAEIEKLQAEAEVYDANLFYTTNCPVGNTATSAIAYRKGKEWKVYETPFGGTFRTSAGFSGYSDDRNYAYFEVNYTAGGNDFEVDNIDFYIIDLVNGSCTGFEKDEYRHNWEYLQQDNSEELVKNSYYSVKSNIIIEGNKFTIMKSVFSEADLDTATYTDGLNYQYGKYGSQSGIYEIEDRKLVKTHYYNDATMRMQPIVYAGKLASGMVLRDVIDVYNPDEGLVVLKEVPRFTYGDDSDEMGYEVWWEDKLQYFLIVPNPDTDVKRIAGLTVISPEIEVHGLHTGMPVGEILKKFPNAKLHIDLINEWEYLYINEYNVRLTFKTDEENRIAKYKYSKKTGEDEAVKVIDKDRKLDYISVI